MRLLELIVATAIVGCTSDDGTRSSRPKNEQDGGQSVTGGTGGLAGAGGQAGVGGDAGSSGAGGDAGSSAGAGGGAGAPVCTLVGLGRTDPIPDACTPRCTLQTAADVSNCGADQMCIRNALQSDPTPSIVADSDSGPVTLDCEACADFQFESCVAMVCLTELDALNLCEAQMPPADCTMEDFALRTCVGNNPVGTCLGMRSGACFDT